MIRDAFIKAGLGRITGNTEVSGIGPKYPYRRQTARNETGPLFGREHY